MVAQREWKPMAQRAWRDWKLVAERAQINWWHRHWDWKLVAQREIGGTERRNWWHEGHRGTGNWWHKGQGIGGTEGWEIGVKGTVTAELYWVVWQSSLSRTPTHTRRSNV